MKSKLVEPRVRKLLRDNEELRSNDKKLIIAYLEAFDGVVLSQMQKDAILGATPFESITRARRALRKDFPGTKETEAKRYGRFIEERDSYGQPIMVWKSDL